MKSSRLMPGGSITPESLEALAGPVARLMGVRGRVAVRVAFLPNQVLQRLKFRYLKRRAAFVNVLAFPEPGSFPHPESNRRMLGEVYLNDSYRFGDPDEGTNMFIHGMAHLCGFNHTGRRDTIEMQAAEDRVRSRLVKIRGQYRSSSHYQGTRHENSHRT